MFRGLVRMHRACPACGADFEREQGYFLGAMYISYGLGLALLAVPVTWLILDHADRRMVIGTALVLLLALSPFLFRISRVAWLHFDHRFDPLPDRRDRGDR